MSHFRLVQCDAHGKPVEPVAALPPLLAENNAGAAAHFRQVGFRPPWVSYVSMSGDTPVGGCAFVAPPAAGRVEIAYFTLPEYENRGFASQAAAALIGIAAATDRGLTVFAKTLPQYNPSTSVLRRLGFIQAGETQDHEIGTAWLWERPALA